MTATRRPSRDEETVDQEARSRAIRPRRHRPRVRDGESTPPLPGERTPTSATRELWVVAPTGPLALMGRWRSDRRVPARAGTTRDLRRAPASRVEARHRCRFPRRSPSSRGDTRLLRRLPQRPYSLCSLPSCVPGSLRWRARSGKGIRACPGSRLGSQVKASAESPVELPPRCEVADERRSLLAVDTYRTAQLGGPPPQLWPLEQGKNDGPPVLSV